MEHERWTDIRKRQMGQQTFSPVICWLFFFNTHPQKKIITISEVYMISMSRLLYIMHVK
uniref:Uncharacterized protein n=1 Tax=Octopus bimaculoides TaxID=37653 RepID=A0A0L8GRB5_OCTBM